MAGTAHDPFWSVASKPAKDLSVDEHRFALHYLFQANLGKSDRTISQVPGVVGPFSQARRPPKRAERYFRRRTLPTCKCCRRSPGSTSSFSRKPTSPALMPKGRDYSLDDQRFVMTRQREVLAQVLPAHTVAAKKGSIEISTTAFYHPILPLVCDTNMGAVSSPGLPSAKPLSLSRGRARATTAWSESASGGLRHSPAGVWPSEGSVL